VGPLLVFGQQHLVPYPSFSMKRSIRILYIIKYLMEFCFRVFWMYGYQSFPRVTHELHPILGKDADRLQRGSAVSGCRMLCVELFGAKIKVDRQCDHEHDSLRNSAERPLLLGVHCGCDGADVRFSRTLGEFALGAVFNRSDIRSDTDAVLVAFGFRAGVIKLRRDMP
jgi:hypothetical protein